MKNIVQLPGFQELVQFFSRTDSEVYIVGGALRDLWLGRSVKDLDLVLKGSTRELAFSFSKKFSFPAFPLHDQLAMYRIVPVPGFSIDFCALQGNDIRDDLQLRDFTINAMAIPFNELHRAKQIHDAASLFLDPTGGLQDLQQKTIRVIATDTFKRDPLRMIRVFRFMTELDFSVDPETLQSISQQHTQIKTVARERIYQELAITLANDCFDALKVMCRTRLLPALISFLGCPESHATQVGLLAAVDQVNQVNIIRASLKNLSVQSGRWLDNYLQTQVAGNIVRIALLNLLLLLPESYRFNNIAQFGRNLTLSKAAIKLMASWQSARIAASHYIANQTNSDPELLRSFLFHHRDSGPLGLLLASLTATGQANLDHTQIADVLHQAISELTLANTASSNLIQQVDGQLIMKLTGLGPSKELGDLIRDIHEKIYIGVLLTLEEVVQHIKQ